MAAVWDLRALEPEPWGGADFTLFITDAVRTAYPDGFAIRPPPWVVAIDVAWQTSPAAQGWRLIASRYMREAPVAGFLQPVPDTSPALQTVRGVAVPLIGIPRRLMWPTLDPLRLVVLDDSVPGTINEGSATVTFYGPSCSLPLERVAS